MNRAGDPRRNEQSMKPGLQSPWLVESIFRCAHAVSTSNSHLTLKTQESHTRGQQHLFTSGILQQWLVQIQATAVKISISSTTHELNLLTLPQQDGSVYCDTGGKVNISGNTSLEQHREGSGQQEGAEYQP